jgi:ferric enterobactin receptor
MKKILLGLVLSFFLVLNLYAQGNYPKDNNSFEGIITGKIIDAVSKSPLEYATVALHKASDSSLVTGATTDKNGIFTITAKPGKYYAKLEFISFETSAIGDITISDSQRKVDLGVVALSATAEEVAEVEIRAEKSSTQIMLDKKVFNVGQDLANQGGTASDILDNVPSVAVDVEGNVSLRGNQNVRILVDGKPSGLVGIGNTDGLKQIPANMIDRVEVITNPSARYEAEGTVGIINIILKKDKRKGLNGTFNVSAGYNGVFITPLANSDKIPLSLGTAINLNYRKKNFNFFLNTGVDQQNNPGGGTTYQEFYRADTFITDFNRQHMRSGLGLNIRFGADYYITEKDVLTASFFYQPNTDENYAEVTYDDKLLSNGSMYPLGITLRSDMEDESESNYEGALNYKKTFAQKDRQFTADFRFQTNGEVAQSVIKQFFDSENIPSLSSIPQLTQRSSNDESEKNYQLQLDYVHPFKENGKFEFGYRGILRTIENGFAVEEDTLGNGNYYLIESVSDNFIYDENIQAVYTSVGDKIKKFSYLVGLRYENAQITTTSVKLDSVNTRTYNSPFFPSVFLSYDLPKKNAMQFSYSRRVRRPGFRELNPFYSFTDARNRFGGNPNLNPEFTHSMELSHIKYFEKSTITSAVYYRITNGSVQRLRRIEIQDGDTITIIQPVNLDQSFSYGLEFTFNVEPTKWLRLNGNFNFFRSILPQTPSPFDPNYTLSNDAYSWSANLTSRFVIDKNTNVQLRFNYQAPQKDIQGSRKAVYFLDLAASKDVMKGNGTITLNFRDIFNTRRWKSTVYIEDELFADSNFQFRSGSLGAAFSYRLNQKKGRGDRPSRGGGEFEGGGGVEF